MQQRQKIVGHNTNNNNNNNNDAFSQLQSSYANCFFSCCSSLLRRRRRQQQRQLLIFVMIYASFLFLTYQWWYHYLSHKSSFSINTHNHNHFNDNSKRKNEIKARQVTIQQSPNSTLALLSPPGLLGGYRNQVLRWIAFVVYAKQHQYQQIYLPSILWSTQVTIVTTTTTNSSNTTTTTHSMKKNFPIPMEWIFDIDYWNQFYPHVPLLISELKDSDCWVPYNATTTTTTTTTNPLHPLQQMALERGYLQPLQNITPLVYQDLIQINPRQQDFLPQVHHCQHPVVYGGGIKAGRLWNGYLGYIRQVQQLHQRNDKPSSSSSSSYSVHEWIYRALRPAPQWRTVAQQCILPHTPHYAVVHARLEIEMMTHNCGRDMEHNLTNILDQVAIVLEDYPKVTGLVIAVSRTGMMINHTTTTTTTTHLSLEHRLFAQYNLQVLNRLVKENELFLVGKTQQRPIQVIECGERLIQEYYATHPEVIDHGSLLHSVVNFDLAINADVFIGVRSSSYSTDVLTSRYHLEKGQHNYRYTKIGQVEKVEGLPEPHSNCARKKREK